jgi:hypothetical protein
MKIKLDKISIIIILCTLVYLVLVLQGLGIFAFRLIF